MTRMLYPACLLLLAAPAFAQGMPAFTVLGGENAPRHAQAPASGAGEGTLLAFWRSNCAPCVAERPILSAIAREHPLLTIALVPLEGDAYTQRHFPVPPAPNMQVWISDTDAETTLRQMGDMKRALPFSVFLRSDGSACETHYGLLGTDLVDEWVKQC